MTVWFWFCAMLEGGFTPVSQAQGPNLSLRFYMFGPVGFGFTLQLGEWTNRLHMTNIILSRSTSRLCTGWCLNISVFTVVCFVVCWSVLLMFLGGVVFPSCCILSLSSSQKTTEKSQHIHCILVTVTLLQLALLFRDSFGWTVVWFRPWTGGSFTLDILIGIQL